MPALAGPIRHAGPRGPRQLQVGPGTFPPPLFGGRTGLWIGGVDYTAYVVAHSPKITTTAYNQIGVFTFRLTGAVPGPITTVAPEQEVQWNVGGVAFGGYVKTLNPVPMAPHSNYMQLDVACQDYTALLEQSIIVYNNNFISNPIRQIPETDQQRIVWIMQCWDRYGISTRNVQTLTGLLPTMDFTGMTVGDAIRIILKIGIGDYYVDVYRDLHTFQSDFNAASFALSDTPDNVTSFGYNNFMYPQDSVGFVNALWVTGGNLGASAPDSGTETITPAVQNVASSATAMASFNQAFGQTITVVNVGTFTVGTLNAVTPSRGLPSVDGNALIAMVSGSGEPTTTQPGWVKIISSQAGGHTQWVAIWGKKNVLAAEGPPPFTCVGTGGAGNMAAQLLEVSGSALQPLDQASATSFIPTTPTSTGVIETQSPAFPGGTYGSPYNPWGGGPGSGVVNPGDGAVIPGPAGPPVAMPAPGRR